LFVRDSAILLRLASSFTWFIRRTWKIKDN
jgi:hypothetical protein